MGMIAEEVGEVIPEIVAFEKNKVHAVAIDYGHLTPLLVEAMKEQQAQIEKLKAELKELRERIGDK